jgi:hypothetical protein
MNRRERMQQVLNAELERWSSMTVDQLLDELREERNYQLRAGSQEYQLEVQLLENTATYLHVSISVDDFRLLSSMFPMSTTFIREKVQPDIL